MHTITRLAPLVVVYILTVKLVVALVFYGMNIIIMIRYVGVHLKALISIPIKLMYLLAGCSQVVSKLHFLKIMETQIKSEITQL